MVARTDGLAGLMAQDLEMEEPVWQLGSLERALGVLAFSCAAVLVVWFAGVGVR